MISPDVSKESGTPSQCMLKMLFYSHSKRLNYV